MTWQLAITISIIANAATILVQRHYAKKSTVPATLPSAASYVFGVAPIGLIAGFFLFPHTIHWSWWLVLLLALEGTTMAISGWTGFRAANRLGVAPRQTIGCITGVTTILLGWTVLGETLTARQLLGAVILLGAALLAIWAPTKSDEPVVGQVRAPAALLAVISAATLGVGLATEKAILGHMQIGGGFLVGWTSQTAAMLLLATKDLQVRHVRHFWHREFKWSTLMGLINGLTGVFYVYAIVHSDNISLVTALTAVALPITVLGAYLFLREREHHKLMWISLGVSFIGLLVTSLK